MGFCRSVVDSNLEKSATTASNFSAAPFARGHFHNNIFGLLVVSSKDNEPINKFVDLFNTNQFPSLLNTGAMDPKILKQYLLVHDIQDGTSEKKQTKSRVPYSTTKKNAESVREEEVISLERNKETDDLWKRGTEHEHNNPNSAVASSHHRIHEVYAEKTLVETEAEKVLQMMKFSVHSSVFSFYIGVTLAEKLNMIYDEAERWIVNLVRNSKLDAKIDSKSGTVVMEPNHVNVVRRVVYEMREHLLRQIFFGRHKTIVKSRIFEDRSSGTGIAEPMISPDDFSKSYLQSLGMSSCFFYNTSPNRVPNIWLFWKTTVATPNQIHCSNQQLTVEIDGVLLSIIHAHCIYVNRRQLWMDLHQLSLMNLPWLILGDFNAYLSYSDKQGGHRPSTAAMSDFRDFVGSNHLMEAPCNGFHFSWWNKQVGRLKILGKLDRMFFNILWSSKYPGWNYKNKNRCSGDRKQEPAGIMIMIMIEAPSSFTQWRIAIEANL
ncbi:hypothetical protein IFM89_036231 [Coptis chinensis]|uniref:PCI domain-containing protein n=1 Tax=Coptis chinensis TaxID=261450 RepID=A0A835MB33_9MAGN|nr:hypothetical protein IFM89_036231 [Coptis chinensis]